MSTLRMWFARLAGLFGTRRRDADLADELSLHLDMEIDALVRAGVSPEDARRQVMSRGDLARATEAYRDQRGVPFIEASLRALRHAARSLRRTPGYMAAIIVSMALGVGVNTAIYSVARGVLWRPLPFANEAELVTVGNVATRAPGDPRAPSWEFWNHDIEAWQSQNRTLQSIAVVSEHSGIINAPGIAEPFKGAAATPNLLSVLGVQPERGRWFSTDESAAEPVIVLASGLARRLFPGDDALGKTIKLHDRSTTIIGIMSEGSGLPLAAAFWVRGEQHGQVIARRRAGATDEQIRADLDRLSPGAANLRRAKYEVDFFVVPLREQLFGAARPELRLLGGAAVLLLLIACANVANLSLARTLERRSEMALRATLGASRRALASLVVAENLLLGAAGAALGIALVFVTTRVVSAFGPEAITVAGPLGVGVPGVLVASLAALGAALLISVAPALAAGRGSGAPMLVRGGLRVGRGRAVRRVRHVLVAAQIALALSLVAGAGLLIRNVARLMTIDLGFTPSGVVVASISARSSRYRDDDARRAFVRDLTARARGLPGVEAVALGPAPLVGGLGVSGYSDGFDMLTGYRDTSRTDDVSYNVWVKHVDAEYLTAYRIPIRMGRAILSSDDRSAARVAVINRTAAQAFFRDSNPVGRQLPFPSRPAPLVGVTVVGVVDDALQRDLTLEALPEVFLPLAQQPVPSSSLTLSLRTTTAPAATIQGLRGIARDLDPELAFLRLETMDSIVRMSLAPHAFFLMVLGAFAVLALTLAVVGLYAVVSYLVAQRRPELGVRLALGAQRYQVFGAVLRESATLVVAGIAIGLPLTLAFSRLLSTLLYEIEPHDTTALLAAPIVLGLVALLAASIPARRAASIDPVRTLRAE